MGQIDSLHCLCCYECIHHPLQQSSFQCLQLPISSVCDNAANSRVHRIHASAAPAAVHGLRNFMELQNCTTGPLQLLILAEQANAYHILGKTIHTWKNPCHAGTAAVFCLVAICCVWGHGTAIPQCADV